MTAVSAFSASRRGSRKPGMYEPLRSFGIFRSTVPALSLPEAVAIAVAVGETIRRAGPVGGAGQPLHLQLHQALSRKPDHPAQEIGVGTLLQKALKAHHGIGHRDRPLVRVECCNPTLTGHRDDPRCG